MIKKPPPVYGLPVDLPIPLSHRHCLELVDEVLAAAVGVHFLELTSGQKAIPRAVIKGYPDNSTLDITAPPAPQAHSPQQGRPPRPAFDPERREKDLAPR